mmetsp:Transcript_12649/g.16324  ORF Transcript_12649/g.16324 Transcript_12649/m.16324 type:complete len:367 (+) Transcript_12649:114-1214(+)
MGGGISRSKTIIEESIEPETIVEDMEPATKEPGEESDLEDFNDFTVTDDYDDASAGTDQRVVRILNLSQKQKNIELLDACCCGDESEVHMLLKYGADTKRIDWDSTSTPFQLGKDGKDRWTPLHAAAREGHRKVCQMLIRAHSPIDSQNGWLRAPIHYAAEHGRRNIILLLLHHGANVNINDWQKYTPLHFAVLRGHRACVKALLEAGADPNARTLGNFSPLHLAAKRGRDDTTLMLLDYGSKVNAKAKGSTPLHEAAKECNPSTVRLLIEYGADIEAVNANRKTPMMLSVLNRDRESEKLLVDAGAFAAHLQPVKKTEEWPELEDEEGEDSLTKSKTDSSKSGGQPPGGLSKFKALSVKVSMRIK